MYTLKRVSERPAVVVVLVQVIVQYVNLYTCRSAFSRAVHRAHFST